MNISYEQATNRSKAKIKNIIGERFGMIVVKEFSHIAGVPGHRGTFWKCICDCGQEKVYSANNLRSGNIKSCGCSRYTVLYKGGKYITGAEFACIRKTANSKNREFTITVEDIEEIFEKQHFRCVLSGRKLSFNQGTRKNKILGDASIDRIDSFKGYTKDNIQILHKDINIAKMQYSNEEFVNLCKEIANYEKNKYNNPNNQN